MRGVAFRRRPENRQTNRTKVYHNEYASAQTWDEIYDTLVMGWKVLGEKARIVQEAYTIARAAEEIPQ